METNIVWHDSTISKNMRESLNNHKGMVLWFTGLSGSGKSTLANAVEARLFEEGCHTYVLDGDNIRHGLSANLGFSDEDRKENIRRIGEVSKLMMDAGMIVMSAFISPFVEDRENARKLMPEKSFLEIYCKADLATCEKRDVKGLYKKARAGEIKNYTGIDSPYEEPLNAELVVETGRLSLEDCADQVVNYLKDNQYIHPGHNGHRSLTSFKVIK